MIVHVAIEVNLTKWAQMRDVEPTRVDVARDVISAASSLVHQERMTGGLPWVVRPDGIKGARLEVVHP